MRPHSAYHSITHHPPSSIHPSLPSSGLPHCTLTSICDIRVPPCPRNLEVRGSRRTLCARACVLFLFAALLLVDDRFGCPCQRAGILNTRRPNILVRCSVNHGSRPSPTCRADLQRCGIVITTSRRFLPLNHPRRQAIDTILARVCFAFLQRAQKGMRMRLAFPSGTAGCERKMGTPTPPTQQTASRCTRIISDSTEPGLLELRSYLPTYVRT
jgi:hypothetical protein